MKVNHTQKVLVTGGAGFIGSAIVPELQRARYEVFVVDDLSFGHRDHIDITDDHFFTIDIRDKESLFSVLEEVGPHWIIHLAAIHFIPHCNKYPYETADINIRGTLNLIEGARNLDSLNKFFFASTAAVYPIFDSAIAETHSPEPLDIYGLTKLTGEHLCNEFFLQTGVTTIICRFFNAFGPKETNPHLIPEIQKQIVGGQRSIYLGNLDPKRDFIHTSDMAIAVRMMTESLQEGIEIFNLGSGIEYSVREIVEAFERGLGEEIKIEIDPERVRKTERMHLLADISKLKAFIPWEPEVDIDEGIKSLIG